MKFDVVLIGTDINAYYMARNFHEAYNIKPYVIGKLAMNFTSLSKIINLEIVDNLNNNKIFVDTLIDTAKKINKEKIILIGCNDDYVSLIINNREILSKYYLFNYPSKDLFEKLVNKSLFYEEFKDSEIDIPKTYIYDITQKFNEKELLNFNYPVILKPSNVIMYHEKCMYMDKIYKLNSLENVYDSINKLKERGYIDKVIIQEYIPGDDTRLFDSVFYCSSNKQVQLQSFAQIGLQEHTKTGIGNLTVAINGYNEFNNTDIIQKKLKDFLEKIGYNGACEFDLKYDERDKKYKVFEINPRQARSSYYLTKCGYNLATYFVDDLIYNKDKDFIFIKDINIISFVPKYVIKKHINNIEYKKTALKLIKEKKYTNPLVYNKDMPFKRRLWLFVRNINYIKKYKINKW